jgi:hypothetical protein
MKKTGFLALCTVAVLAGCGGGGGGGGGGASSDPVAVAPGAPAVSATLTPTNYRAAAVSAVSATFSYTGIGSLVTGASVGVARPAAAQALDTVKRLMKRPFSGPSIAVGATVSETLACPGGGSFRFAVTDVNNNTNLDAGDSVSATFDNCLEGGSRLTGTLAMSFTAVTGDLDTDVYSATVNVTLTNFGGQDSGVSAVANGNINMVLNSTSSTNSSATVVLSNLTSTVSAAGFSDTSTFPSYRVTVSTSAVGGTVRASITADGSFSSTTLGNGSISVTTPTPFVLVGGALYPSSGQMLITGGGNSRLRLTALDAATALLELDADGNGTYELSVNSPWTDLT